MVFGSSVCIEPAGQYIHVHIFRMNVCSYICAMSARLYIDYICMLCMCKDSSCFGHVRGKLGLDRFDSVVSSCQMFVHHMFGNAKCEQQSQSNGQLNGLFFVDIANVFFGKVILRPESNNRLNKRKVKVNTYVCI